jgi:hypothetical protein
LVRALQVLDVDTALSAAGVPGHPAIGLMTASRGLGAPSLTALCSQ